MCGPVPQSENRIKYPNSVRKDVSWVDHTVWNRGYKSLGKVRESCATLVLDRLAC